MTQTRSSVSPRLPGTLLVPLDGSDMAARAIPIATAIADDIGADVVVMTTPPTRDAHEHDNTPEWLIEAAEAARAKSLVVLDDNPASAIATTAAELGDAVVCMSTHGHGRVSGAAFGHVAENVVRRVGSPVVLVGPECAPWHPGPLLVCHDGSTAADAIIPSARTWATALGIRASLAFAFHPLDTESARELPRAVIDAAAALGASTSLHSVRDAYPAGAVLNLARQLRPALIAMSTHGRTGWGRLALGSVATTVIRSSPCPVLVLRSRDANGTRWAGPSHATERNLT
jgi:nucleotide-binding universal stress UspA family protein